MKEKENNKEKYKEAIIRVIAFFDKFDFPLSSFEIWRFLPLKCDYFEILAVLDEMILLNNSRINFKNGFYFLPQRSDIIEKRMMRYNYADRKFKKALFFVRIFRFIPWIKMIGIANIIGANNTRDAGDIDFFIVTEKGRIWISRFFCVLFAKVLRARPSFRKTRDTICLSFYVTEDSLDLETVSYGQRDYYFLYWLAGLVPVYDKGKYYSKLIFGNKWLLRQLPNWKKFSTNKRRIVAPLQSFVYRDIVDMLFGGLEPWLKKKQLQIMPESLARAINYPSKAVIVSDSILKLHANDRREIYNKAWKI